MYKLIFDLHGSYSTSTQGQYLYIAPLNGSTNISNGNLYSAGWSATDSSSRSYGSYGGTGTANSYEFEMSGIIGTGNASDTYSAQFDATSDA